MTPGESAAMAAWVAAIVSVLFGGTGFVVGIVGLRHSRQAKEAAAASNLIAKDATALSKAANQISKESNGIARQANKLSKKNADRDDEQHDVAWEWMYEPGPLEYMVKIQNIGKHVACNAIVQLFFGNLTEANPEPLEIEGRSSISFKIPGLRESVEAHRKAVAEYTWLRERTVPDEIMTPPPLLCWYAQTV